LLEDTLSGALPIGFLSIREAADVVAESMFIGVPDRPLVAKSRQMNLDVDDGTAINDAVAELWKAVDAWRLRPVAVGGRPRRIVRLDPTLTAAIPGLRSPRGRGFTLLRPRSPYYGQIVAWFGLDLASVTVAFRETEVRALASRLKRTRRRKANAQPSARRSGRPSRQRGVAPIILDIIARGKWSSTGSLKDLTSKVNRLGKFYPPVSEDTVTRALDRHYNETGDRLFQRIPRKRQAAKQPKKDKATAKPARRVLR
jgi:hypothetical protein